MYLSSIIPLLLPTFVSAIAVFILSSLVHMVIRWHQNDQAKLPNEDSVAAALKGTPNGEYRMPWAANMEEMKSPAWIEKAKSWPHAVVGVTKFDLEKGFMRALVLWFVYSLVVSFVSGHIAHAALHEGGPHTALIFHTVGLSAFLGYGMALAQQSIWGPKPWWATAKGMIDSVFYAAATAGVFVWLWPK